MVVMVVVVVMVMVVVVVARWGVGGEGQGPSHTVPSCRKADVGVGWNGSVATEELLRGGRGGGVSGLVAVPLLFCCCLLFCLFSLWS